MKKMNMSLLKKIGVIVIGVLAAQEILPYYAKARNKIVTTVKG